MIMKITTIVIIIVVISIIMFIPIMYYNSETTGRNKYNSKKKKSHLSHISRKTDIQRWENLTIWVNISDSDEYDRSSKNNDNDTILI